MPADRPHRPSRPVRPTRPPRPARPPRTAVEEPWRITSRPPRKAPEPADDAGGRGRRGADEDDGRERLQKVLAAAGLGSRRACEELIAAGRVEVDRQVVTQLGTRIDPHAQEVRVDGERLPDPKRVVYMLNKPVGVVTTNADPAGRPRVVDLVPGERRLFAIGRLDRMSEGLILVTNDGELANLLAHPRYGVEKKYLVQVAGVPTPELLERLRQGVVLAEGRVQAKRVEIRSQHKQSAVLEMILDEGKNREIRRMLARLGHKVHQLKRVGVGRLSLGNLLPGQWRPLAWSEIESLRRDAIAAVGPVEAARVTAGRGGDDHVDGDRRRGGAPHDRRPRGVGQGRSGQDRPAQGRPGQGRPGQGRVGQGRPAPGRPGPQGRPGKGRPGKGRPATGRPAIGGPAAGGPATGGPAVGGPKARGGPGDAGPGQGRRPGGPPRRPRRPGKASTWRKRGGPGTE